MKKEKYVWGILLVLGGILLLVSKLGYLGDVNAFSLLVSMVLVVIIVKSAVRFQFGGILFPLAFIAILYDDQLGITKVTPWTVLFAALLGTIGFTLIFGKKQKYIGSFGDKNLEDFDIIDVEDESHIKFRTSFGASVKYVNSDNFQQAEFECSFGAMKVYFDNTIIQDGKAVVSINASFSGVELYIPKEWTVENRISASLAGVDEKNRNQSNGTPVLVLVGNVSFAGVEITYV